MFSIAKFAIAKIWNQHKCPSINECEIHTHTHTHTHTMEYYSAIKRNKMAYAVTWIELEFIILGEVTQE